MKAPSLFRTTCSLIALLALAPVVRADTLVVTNTADSGAGTLRDTVASANPGDTIVFDSSLSGQTILLTSGQIVLSNNVTIDGSALASAIQLNGSGSNRIFYVNSGVTVTNNSLIITNGQASGGGGIYNSGGTLTVNNCTLANNNSTSGGGVYNLSGTLTVNDCSIASNSAATYGGGIYNNSGTLTLNNCALTNNNTGLGYSGGGIYNNSGTMTVNNCTLANNTSGSGGGIRNSSGALTLNNCTLANNSGSYDGGGIFNQSGPLTVNNCTLANNSSGDYGGGIFNLGTLTVNNCTLANNNSTHSGGGIYNGHMLNLTNSIVSLNSGGDISGSYSGSSNLVGRADINLAPLGNYGGPTMTMPPLPGSPAIDAGNDGVTNFLATDQRGYPRLSGAHVDVGAVEVQFVAANPNNPPVLMNSVWSATGGGAFQFTFTNVSGADFTALTSTNVSLPLSNWTVLGNIPEIAPGQYQFTDPGATNSPQRFYRVISP